MSLPGYDDWKTTDPRDMEPERQTDPGECRLCRGSGIILVNRRGRYIGAGPFPDDGPHGLWESDCPSCGGAGEIVAEENEEEEP